MGDVGQELLDDDVGGREPQQRPRLAREFFLADAEALPRGSDVLEVFAAGGMSRNGQRRKSRVPNFASSAPMSLLSPDLSV